MLVLMVGFVTSCGAQGPAAGGLERVTRPGVVLVVPERRAAELRALPPAERDAWCPAARGRPPPPVPALAQRGDEADKASEPFALDVMQDAAAGIAGEAEAEERLVALLDGWARAGALLRPARPSTARNYALDRTLLPTLVAFASLGEPARRDPERLDRIRLWLAVLVESRRRPAKAGITLRNNHHYLRGSVDIAWGALTTDGARFASGIAAYRDAISDLRADGSLPLETRRGARALWYQRHAIASLVVIAEIAANQGVDLYAYRWRGRDLHTAIRFLLDAVEDPSLVRPYARADQNPRSDLGPDAQDLTFLTRRGHQRHYMAWTEIYAARFPDRPETARLLRLLERSDPGFRPMLDDYSGGNTTCLFARP